MPKVLIAPMTLASVQGAFLHLLHEAGFETFYPNRNHQLSEEELLATLDGAVGTLAGMEPYTQRVLAAHPSLRVIARVGVGYDAVDTSAATAHGVAVCIAPGTNQEAVAEHTMSLLLGIAKDVGAGHIGTREGRWPRRITQPIRGRVLGLAGLGRIGKAVAVRAAAFGMRVIAYDPIPDATFARQQGIELVSFERLLAESDFLSLHLPLMAESRHLINRQTLARMKPGSYLINTARGGLVCEADLIDALRSGHLGGAGLDVFEAEPPPPSALFEMHNVLVTPHTAGTDTQSLADMARCAAEAIVDISRGRWPAEKVVNPAVQSRFRW